MHEPLSNSLRSLSLALGLCALADSATAVTLTVNITGTPPAGNVSVISGGGICSGIGSCVYNITAGTALRIVANSQNTPGVISGGTGDASACATSTCLFTINNNSSINVSFSAGSYPSISFTLAGDGTGEVGTDNTRCQNFELETSPCTSFYATGSTVTLEGRSMPGNLFVSFSGGTGPATSCSTTPCVFTLSGSATVTATFRALASVAVTPPTSTREAGHLEFFSATGTFTNSGTRSLFTNSGRWSNSKPMAVTRYSSAGVALGQRFYVFGGGVANGPPSTRLDSYNPILEIWTQRASMPSAHTEFAGAALSGLIYAVGGHTVGGSAVATVEAYDPGLNSWAAKASLPAARASLAVVSLGGFLYAVGGDPNIGGQNTLLPVASLDRYTPGSPGSWTAMAPMTTARTQLVAAAVGGKLYALGGNTGSGTSGEVEVYDPGNNTWTSKTPLSPPRPLLSASALNGLIYAPTVDAMYVYNPATDSWSTLGGMQTPRGSPAVDTLDGRLWVAGGKTGLDNSTQTTVLETFRPPETLWWSNNSAVATLSQPGQVGQANAVSPGSATIIAQVGPIDCSSSGGCGTLTVTAPTTVATSTGASVVTTSSAILGGTVSTTSGPSIIERGVVYSVNSLNPSPMVGGFNVNKVTTSGTTGAFSITVSGLTSGTQYVYRAYATTNQSTYGAPVLFATASPPPPSVTATAATNVSLTTANVAGNVTSDGGASITERGFVFSLFGTNADPIIGGGGVTKLPVAGTLGAFATTLSSLTAATKYAWKAFATNGVGTTYTPVSTFTTSDTAAAEALVASSISTNSASQFTISNAAPQVWYRARFFANRSYQISAWPVDHQQGVDAAKLSVSLFSDDVGTVQANGVTGTSGSLEGTPNQGGDDMPFTAVVQPTAAGVYKIRVMRVAGGSVSQTVNLMVRETTLFSPWTSRAAGFEGFVEMHNNTNAALSVTLSAYSSAGVLQGTPLTLTLQPNATNFSTAAQIGVPAGAFAGIVLAHNGAFGAVSGNITTLNGANGLSFDSPFTTRDSGLQALPVR